MNAIYDSIIYGFLFLDGVFFVLAIFWIRRQGFEWKRFLLATSLTISWLIIFYGSFIEPQMLVVREQTIILDDKSTETLRAVLVSDFHLGPYKKTAFVEKVVTKILELTPDVVFIAGDFVYDNTEQIQYLDPLKNLKAPLGVFAVLGNHDYGQGGPGMILEKGDNRVKAVREKLETLGVRVLVNNFYDIKKGEKNLILFGVDDVWSGRAEILKVSDAFDAKIVLSHNPDIIHKAVRHGVNLVLAGHTHGGQIRLPGIGSVPDIPDELGRAYDRGLFQFEKGTQLFITSGLGETGPRARLLTPPEIVLLNIKF